MAGKRPDIINPQKASKHLLKPGRFYQGEVTSVDSSGRVMVHVKDMGNYGPITPIGTTKLNRLKNKDTVQFTFTDEFFTDGICFGSTRMKDDVFADKTVVTTLVSTVSSLQSQINALSARITALENQ